MGCGLTAAPRSLAILRYDVIVQSLISDTIGSVVQRCVNSRSRWQILYVINISVKISAHNLSLAQHQVNILLGDSICSGTVASFAELRPTATCSALDRLDDIGELTPTAFAGDHLTWWSLKRRMLGTEAAEITVLEQSVLVFVQEGEHLYQNFSIKSELKLVTDVCEVGEGDSASRAQVKSSESGLYLAELVDYGLC